MSVGLIASTPFINGFPPKSVCVVGFNTIFEFAYKVKSLTDDIYGQFIMLFVFMSNIFEGIWILLQTQPISSKLPILDAIDGAFIISFWFISKIVPNYGIDELLPSVITDVPLLIYPTSSRL